MSTCIDWEQQPPREQMHCKRNYMTFKLIHKDFIIYYLKIRGRFKRSFLYNKVVFDKK